MTLHPQPFQGVFPSWASVLQQAEIPFGFWRTAHGGEGENAGGSNPPLWATAAPITRLVPSVDPIKQPQGDGRRPGGRFSSKILL